MALPGPQRLDVRRLRVRDGRGDAVAARLRTERALARLDLRPRALPPAAILLVRSLRARLADAPAELDALARTAARPAREAVPANAAAVVFADHAELLACLAVDWCSGVAYARWWWHLFAPQLSESGASAALEASPEAVPSAFAVLAREGRAIDFVRRLGDPEAARLVSAVARAHGIAAPTPPPAAERGIDRPEPARSRASAPLVTDATSEATAAVADAVPEADAPALSPQQRVLLRLALTLHRRPHALRAAQPLPARSSEAPAGTAVAPEPPPFAVAATDSRDTARPERPRHMPIAARSDQPQPVTPASPSHPPARADQGTAETAGRVASAATPPADPRPLPAGSAARSTDAPEGSPQTPPAADEPPAAATPAPDAGDAEAVYTPYDWAEPVETALGGLLFVIGVAQRLGLYADFTEPAAPGLALDPWRFVAGVGTRLVDMDVHADDPVWALLDEVARDDASADEAPQELATHVAAVRAWLEEHVDLPLRAVLERRALVHVDEIRVDAVFSLVDHPIELRLAGLDLDPGWIPAAGRALYFHFE